MMMKRRGTMSPCIIYENEYEIGVEQDSKYDSKHTNIIIFERCCIVHENGT